MIRFNIIGHGFLDVAETGGIAFKTQNQHFRFCDISLGRSVEFSVPATDHNRQMLDFGEDAAETGEMLRRVYPCQLVYDGGAKMGTIMVTGFSSEAFSCVFTIGNAEWLQAIQERKLADCPCTWDKGVPWSTSVPASDANAVDPVTDPVAVLRYENGFTLAGWQLCPSVNVATYCAAVLNDLGIPFTTSLVRNYWMVAGSMKGGGVDPVTLTQTDNTSFAVTQTQNYLSVEDITIEWATANMFGALVGGGSGASKAFKANADLKVTFPQGITGHVFLVKWNAKLKRCEVLGATFETVVFKNLNGMTLDIAKNDLLFFADKPLLVAGAWYGWKNTDISTVTISATIERNADLQLGEVWYLRNNQPDMTVFEFLKSVALAAGLELTVDGETGVTMTAGAYGTNTMKALERVVAADSVTRRVESWGSGTQKAVVKFDSEEYVTEPINADFVIDNDQFDEVSEHVSKFSEGNVGTNGILIEDVEAGHKFKAKKWTIAFVDSNSAYLQRAPTPDPVGYDDLATNSTCLRAKIAAPLAEFFDLQPSTVYVWRGCAYLWTDADWSDGVLGLTLQRVSQPQQAATPT